MPKKIAKKKAKQTKPPAKSAPAKKATAKSAPAKKATAKSAPAKKATAKKPTAKNATAKNATARKAPAKSPPARKAPAKSPPAKNATAKNATAKSSPLKGMPIDEWVRAKVPASLAASVTEILGIVRDAAPDATASIKWGQPVFEQNGPFAYVKPAKTHVTFGFWRGAEMTDAAGVLEGEGGRMKHVKLTALAAVDREALAAMVKEAVELNRTKGNPTKR